MKLLTEWLLLDSGNGLDRSRSSAEQEMVLETGKKSVWFLGAESVCCALECYNGNANEKKQPT